MVYLSGAGIPRFPGKKSIKRVCVCMCVVVVVVVVTQAEMKFHDLSAMWKDGGVLSVDNQCQPRGAVNKPVIPPISFEVRSCDSYEFVICFLGGGGGGSGLMAFSVAWWCNG